MWKTPGVDESLAGVDELWAGIVEPAAKAVELWTETGGGGRGREGNRRKRFDRASRAPGASQNQSLQPILMLGSKSLI
jgi:hypothetical protein